MGTNYSAPWGEWVDGPMPFSVGSFPLNWQLLAWDKDGQRAAWDIPHLNAPKPTTLCGRGASLKSRRAVDLRMVSVSVEKEAE